MAAIRSPSPSRWVRIPDIDTVNVQNRASLATAVLPPEVSHAGLTIRKKSAALLQIINIYSPNNTYDSIYLSNYATINIIDTLARIKGVGQVNLLGPLDYSLRIWIDPDRLAQFNLTPNDLINAVANQNTQAALGRIGAAPVSTDQQVQLTIKTTGRLARPEEFAQIVLRANPDGSVVRIKDVARVETGSKIAGSPQPVQRSADGCDRHLPVAGLQRCGCGGSRARIPEPRCRRVSPAILPTTCSSTAPYSSLRPRAR